VESRQVIAATKFGCTLLRIKIPPVQASGDHQMQDEEQVVIEDKDNAFADAAKRTNFFAFDLANAGYRSAQQQWAGDAEVFQSLPDNPRRQRGEVGRDVGKFGHAGVDCALVICLSQNMQRKGYTIRSGD